MKNIETEKIELFARKYIIDMGIAAIFIFFALVLAERPKVDYLLLGRMSMKNSNALPADSLKKAGRTAPEKAAPPVTPAKDSYDGLDSSDFFADEFRIQEKDVAKLCEAIRSDDYKLGTIKAAGNSIEWLNAVLQVADLFDKVREEKPDLVLTGETRKLKEQTEEKRNKPFNLLTDDERKAIRRLNRLILESAYPKEIPRSRNLEVRNIFEPEGNYEKPPELIIIPENPYNLIAVLAGKEKRVIMREYTGRMVSFKTGDKMIDGAVVSEIDKLSVTVKKGKKKKEYKIFEVKIKKGNK
ncbi:MAG: hypothetical protein HQL08_12225 [Nitrospirae bacterium]|nr:hypothetical protein [Nitrospirota bacterium]